MDDETIGIFINNQHINRPAKDSNLTKRLFSCVSKTSDGNDIRNIFTILNNGNLYMGGNVVQYNPEGEKVDNDSIPQFSDYMNIEVTDNTVMINENGVNVGNKNLLEYIDEQIRNVMTNIYLVEHSHGIGGAPVVSTAKQNVKGDVILDKTSGFGNVLRTVSLENMKIALAGKTNKNPSEVYGLLYTDVDEFINAIALKIKEGTRTTTEGSKKPEQAAGVKGYYVEYLGG